MRKSIFIVSGIALVSAVTVFGLVALRDDSVQTNIMSRSTNEKVIIREKTPDGTAHATFAGGCFWCTEAAFQETKGVTNAIAGYAGGEEHNPTYKDVYTESTGHREALRIYYKPDVITYEELLDIYWRIIDPTDPDGQFVDKGMSYTTAIFYETEEERITSEASKEALADSGRFEKPIVTKILPFTTFYEAEEYHQDFYIKSPDRYESYEGASGREEFKDLVWGEIQKENI